MAQPNRPTRIEDVDLGADEFSWILDSRRHMKGVMDKIKECYAAGVDMTQFYQLKSCDYVIPTFQKALDEKLKPPPAPAKPKSRSTNPEERRRKAREREAAPAKTSSKWTEEERKPRSSTPRAAATRRPSAMIYLGS